MRKTDKNTENQLRQLLTDVCNEAMETYPGFQWLTHLVNYDNFPASLRIVCVFDTNEQLSDFVATDGKSALNSLIEQQLQAAGIKLNKAANHIRYDTEESCELAHQGNWAARLR
ncbi:Fis family transcriptional regulator (plasmid) [Photobacterium sp. GJ3]|uniref:Fis family transcriptional regulator n=1 Tax=Photobacterium sp. GJ3 TaxID=2829502 RepID=UPI001B8C94FA|nr:Fis family transcriptional regulator [Photobacterium sp. GJ3]QUJ69539.1 Fis family transcriptional regulator [Photobacterium sp. GJ3]